MTGNRFLTGERGSVTLGQFSPSTEEQLANSRISPLLILLSAAILLVGLGLNRLTGEPGSVPVSVDASPFARVRVMDARQEILFQKDTPFVASLEPGEYSFQFSYGSGTVTKAVHVSPDRRRLVRHQFWTGKEVESLVGRFLASGAER